MRLDLKLNPKKCEFKKEEIFFFGPIIGKQGIKPDPEKIQMIINLPRPRDKNQVQSLVTMFNYLTIIHP